MLLITMFLQAPTISISLRCTCCYKLSWESTMLEWWSLYKVYGAHSQRIPLRIKPQCVMLLLDCCDCFNAEHGICYIPWYAIIYSQVIDYQERLMADEVFSLVRQLNNEEHSVLIWFQRYLSEREKNASDTQLTKLWRWFTSMKNGTTW